MKDTIVTARRKKIELITLLVCFVVSNLGDFASLV